MAQLEPGDRLLPHELICPKSAGLVVTLAITRGAAPVSLRVTVCGNPLVATNWFGKVMLDGEILATGATALPVSIALCGLPGALSVMINDAVRVPEVAGVKIMLNVQPTPAGTLVPQ